MIAISIFCGLLIPCFSLIWTMPRVRVDSATDRCCSDTWQQRGSFEAKNAGSVRHFRNFYQSMR